jgi:hypothetical protein
MATEVAHFLRSAQGEDVYPTNQLVWSKLSYVLGVVHPYVPGLSSADTVSLQKATFDFLWEQRLADIVSMIPLEATRPDFGRIAERLNGANEAHAATMKNFQQVYEDEFTGGLDIAAEIGQHVLEERWQLAGGAGQRITDAQRQESTRQIARLLVSTFRLKRSAIVQALPTLHIGALCHAAVRWDQKRKLSGNDLFDFHHAQAALPYCNVFLTERPLHHLLAQKRLDIESSYSCRVISSPTEAVEFLTR